MPLLGHDGDEFFRNGLDLRPADRRTLFGKTDQESQITQAVDQGDGEAAVRLAHTLKGVSGSIGADALQQAATEVEAALKADSSALPEGLTQAALELDRVLDKISAMGAEALTVDERAFLERFST